MSKLEDFLNEAAIYFSKRPTNGEDAAHWSNVYNAENCRKAADALSQQEKQIERLREALLRIRTACPPGMFDIDDVDIGAVADEALNDVGGA